MITSIPGTAVPAAGRRNGLPPPGEYVHPGWQGGRPSRADWTREEPDGLPNNVCASCRASMNSRRHRRDCRGEALSLAVRAGRRCRTCGYGWQSDDCIAECGEVPVLPSLRVVTET